MMMMMMMVTNYDNETALTHTIFLSNISVVVTCKQIRKHCRRKLTETIKAVLILTYAHFFD
jgi:hypothetical protein